MEPATCEQSDRPDDHPPTPRRRGWAVLALLGALYVLLAFTSLTGKSVTIDEFGHLPVGYNVLTTGNFDYCQLNPPLMNVLSALPLLALDLPPSSVPRRSTSEHKYSFWLNGYDFMFGHEQGYHHIYVVARCVTVFLVALLGVLVFVWARTLATRRADLAGLLAAALVWFSPGVLAHARLVTTDAGATLFICLALWSLHRVLRRPTWAAVVACGVALGLAQLSKFTAVWLCPVFVVLAVVWRLSSHTVDGRRLALRLLAVFVVSIIVINAGYLFQHTLPTVERLEFVSQPLIFLKDVLPGWLRVPLPERFLLAFDAQLDAARGGDPSYLFGESYHGGRWYFFVALLAIKVPIPMLGLAALAVAVAIRRRRRLTTDSVLLLLPAGVLVAVFSLLSNKQLGLRMILPAAPLFCVWAAVTLARVDWTRLRTYAVSALLVWFAGESLRAYPDYLAYFNQFVGGPSRGYRCAIGSNLDWGQDLIGLKSYVDDVGDDSIQLLYFGRVDPAVYGLRYAVPTDILEPGLVAVSVSLLGRGYLLNDHGTYFWAGPIRLDPAVFGEPITTIGHTIQVYRVQPRR